MAGHAIAVHQAGELTGRDRLGRALELELDQSANGVAPGQLACLMREDRIVGEGTIGEPS